MPLCAAVKTVNAQGKEEPLVLNWTDGTFVSFLDLAVEQGIREELSRKGRVVLTEDAFIKNVSFENDLRTETMIPLHKGDILELWRI